MMQFPYGRPGLLAMRVVAILPSGLRCERPESTIIGEIRNPYKTPDADRYVTAEINTRYAATGLINQQIDAAAVYAVDDVIAVMEQWVVIPVGRMLGNVDLSKTEPVGPSGFAENAQALDYLTNPTPYYEGEPREKVFEANYVAIGKWRQAPRVVFAAPSMSISGGATHTTAQNLTSANEPYQGDAGGSTTDTTVSL